MDEPHTFGRRLEAARLAAGAPKYRQLEREAFRRLGSTAVSATAIANYHHGRVTPERANLELVCFFAERYGVRVGDLSPVLAERLEGARDLITSAKPCTTTRLAGAA